MRKLLEGHRDVGSREARAIGADDDNLVVAEAGEFFGRGLEALGEVRADLFMRDAAFEAGQSARAKEMEIRKSRGLRETAPGEEGTEKPRQPAPGQIESGRVSKDEDGFSSHTGSESIFR